MNNISNLNNRFFIFFILVLYHACLCCESSEDHCKNNSNNDSNSSVISFYEERDLELFDSLQQTNQGIFSSKLDKTYTSFGKARLIHHLKNPITDISLLKSRQKQLKILIENPELLEQLKTFLKKIHDYEDNLVYFIENQEDQISKKAVENFYFKSKKLKNFNKSATALDTRNYVKYLGLFTPVLEHLIFHFALEYAHDKLSHSGKCKHHHKHDHHFCVGNLVASANSSLLMKSSLFLLKAAHLGIHLVGIMEMIDQLSSEKAVINQLYNKVAATRTCLLAMKDILALIQTVKYSTLAFSSDNSYLNYLESTSSNQNNNLIKLLNSKAFNINSSLKFLSRIGNTLSSYKILKQQRAPLKSLAMIIGDLDALVSIAQWYNEANQKYTRVCFVNFVKDDSANSPIINMKNIWNLALDHNNIVTNDIKLNTENGTKIIITGPNKAGKSSTLKAVGLNIILAQTFGIVAAKSAKLTIFHKLITSIMVTDDISSDRSMLVAELMRAEQCLTTLNRLKQNEYACLLVDDTLFKGTTFEKGQQLAYQFAKDIGNFKNGCSIIATHLPILTQLEQEDNGIFRNYHISLSIDANGRPCSTFRLEPGISDQRRVFDIIKSDYNLDLN